MDRMTIGELANSAHVPPRTIRFYETKRLLPAPRRSPSGYRLYDQADLRRLTLIRRFRALGFSLAEVQQLIRLAEHESCLSFLGQVAHEMVRKVGEVEKMIERLQRTRQELEGSLTALSQRTGGDCQQTGLEIDCPCLGA